MGRPCSGAHRPCAAARILSTGTCGRPQSRCPGSWNTDIAGLRPPGSARFAPAGRCTPPAGPYPFPSCGSVPGARPRRRALPALPQRRCGPSPPGFARPGGSSQKSVPGRRRPFPRPGGGGPPALCRPPGRFLLHIPYLTAPLAGQKSSCAPAPRYRSSCQSPGPPVSGLPAAPAPAGCARRCGASPRGFY